MGLDDLVRNVVDLAGDLSVDFQATVQHRAPTSFDRYNKPVFTTPAVPRQAIVADAHEAVRDIRGEVFVCRTQITFLGDVAVGLDDEITLPSGRKPLIRKVDSGALAKDGTRFVTRVLCD